MRIVVVNQAGTDWWQFGAAAVSALATLAAVVVALVVAFRDGRARDRERRDADAGQARLVNFETDLSGSAGEPVKLLLVNHSLQPVHDLQLVSVVGVDKVTEERYVASELYGGVDLSRPHSRLRPYGTQDGSETWRFSPSGWAPEGDPDAKQSWTPRRDGWAGAEWECRYRFTDSRGLRWERLNNEPPAWVPQAAAAGGGLRVALRSLRSRLSAGRPRGGRRSAP